MLTEMFEFGCKMKEEMKAIQSEIKENLQGTISEGKETRVQIKDLEHNEEINIQPEQNEETMPTNEERLRNLRDNFKHSNNLIKVVLKGEEEGQEIESLYENIMK